MMIRRRHLTRPLGQALAEPDTLDDDELICDIAFPLG